MTGSAEERPLALVTGGVRRLGGEIAKGLAARGYDLLLVSHDASGDDIAPIEAAGEGSVMLIEADLSKRGCDIALFDQVAAKADRMPDLLVNNAGLFGQEDWDAVDHAALEQQFALNLFAPVLLARTYAERLDGRSGAVINIIDQRVRNPVVDQASYTLSKQALAEATRTLARALAPNVRVNGVAPGLTFAEGQFTDAQLDEVAAMMPLGCLPDSADIAAAVAYLAEAGATTGQILFVDGGAHMESYGHDFATLVED